MTRDQVAVGLAWTRDNATDAVTNTEQCYMQGLTHSSANNILSYLKGL